MSIVLFNVNVFELRRSETNGPEQVNLGLGLGRSSGPAGSVHRFIGFFKGSFPQPLKGGIMNRNGF